MNTLASLVRAHERDPQTLYVAPVSATRATPGRYEGRGSQKSPALDRREEKQAAQQLARDLAKERGLDTLPGFEDMIDEIAGFEDIVPIIEEAEDKTELTIGCIPSAMPVPPVNARGLSVAAIPGAAPARVMMLHSGAVSWSENAGSTWCQISGAPGDPIGFSALDERRVIVATPGGVHLSTDLINWAAVPVVGEETLRVALQNPSFEDGLTGWTMASGATPLSIPAVWPTPTDKAHLLSSDPALGAAGAYEIEQAASLTPDQQQAMSAGGVLRASADIFAGAGGIGRLSLRGSKRHFSTGSIQGSDDIALISVDGLATGVAGSLDISMSFAINPLAAPQISSFAANFTFTTADRTYSGGVSGASQAPSAAALNGITFMEKTDIPLVDAATGETVTVTVPAGWNGPRPVLAPGTDIYAFGSIGDAAPITWKIHGADASWIGASELLLSYSRSGSSIVNDPRHIMSASFLGKTGGFDIVYSRDRLLTSSGAGADADVFVEMSLNAPAHVSFPGGAFLEFDNLINTIKFWRAPFPTASTRDNLDMLSAFSYSGSGRVLVSPASFSSNGSLATLVESDDVFVERASAGWVRVSVQATGAMNSVVVAVAAINPAEPVFIDNVSLEIVSTRSGTIRAIAADRLAGKTIIAADNGISRISGSGESRFLKSVMSGLVLTRIASASGFWVAVADSGQIVSSSKEIQDAQPLYGLDVAQLVDGGDGSLLAVLVDGGLRRLLSDGATTAPASIPPGSRVAWSIPLAGWLRLEPSGAMALSRDLTTWSAVPSGPASGGAEALLLPLSTGRVLFAFAGSTDLFWRENAGVPAAAGRFDAAVMATAELL